MDITLYQVPFSRILEIEELRDPKYGPLGIMERERREWFYFDLIPYGVGALNFLKDYRTISIGPIWVSEDFQGRGVSTKYTGALAHYALHRLEKTNKILEMSPLFGEVTNRHLRNDWEYLGTRPGDNRYTKVRKILRQVGPQKYEMMLPNFTFKPVDFVFRKQEAEDVDRVYVYKWEERMERIVKPGPVGFQEELPYTLLDSFSYVTDKGEE